MTPARPAVEPADRHGRLAPSPEVAEAIARAVAEAWPRPAPPTGPRSATGAWRFSGRWWARPAVVRRSRP